VATECQLRLHFCDGPRVGRSKTGHVCSPYFKSAVVATSDKTELCGVEGDRSDSIEMVSQCPLGFPHLCAFTVAKHIRLVVFDLDIIFLNVVVVLPWTAVPGTVFQIARIREP
jgi:hypothetical protein